MSAQVPPYRTFLASDTTIREVLRETRTIALVGFGTAADDPAVEVARGIRAYGYRLLPVQSELSTWLDLPCSPTLAAIGENPDMVVVFGDPERASEHAEAAQAAGARALWLAKDVVNARAAFDAFQRGLVVVMNRCILREYEMHFPDDETGFDD